MSPFESVTPRILRSTLAFVAFVATLVQTAVAAAAPEHHGGGEANLVLPDLGKVTMLGMSGSTLLTIGMGVTALGLVFGLVTMFQVKNLPAHKSMTEISNIIWETCKTYLINQGRFILLLELFIRNTQFFLLSL